MCLLRGANWVLISQKTVFFLDTAPKTSNLTEIKLAPLLKTCVTVPPGLESCRVHCDVLSCFIATCHWFLMFM
jgi:hypothetical protein